METLVPWVWPGSQFVAVKCPKAEKGSGLEKRILSYLLVVAIFPFQGLTPYPLPASIG